MTNMSKFKKDLEGAVSIRVDRSAVHMTKLAARVAFEQLTTPGVWPVATFYSIANHKIAINGAAIGSPFPAERPDDDTKNLSGLAQKNRQQQLNKLKGLKARMSVIIGNPVNYAGDVGFQGGQGGAIYAEAARFANSMVAAEKVTEETIARGNLP